LAGIDRLLKDIQNKMTGQSNPFAPQNLKEVQDADQKGDLGSVKAIPPKISIVTNGGNQLNDILRNWTKVTKKFLDLSTKTATYKCGPVGKLHNTSWIPYEQREVTVHILHRSNRSRSSKEITIL
jgi:hypothetical protein